MLARANRFHGQASLRRLQRTSQTVRGPQLTLKYALNNRRRTYRVAVVVSRKVSKSAVVRNRIRRRVYENVRILFGDIQQPYDTVFIAYDERLATLPAEQLAGQIAKLCRKAGISPGTVASHGIVTAKNNV